MAFVETLAAVGVSGIAIGEDMEAPPLSQDMLDAADRRELPLLFTAFEVPFIQISRTVAAASQGPEHLRLVKTVRIYDSVRAAGSAARAPLSCCVTLARRSTAGSRSAPTTAAWWCSRIGEPAR